MIPSIRLCGQMHRRWRPRMAMSLIFLSGYQQRFSFCKEDRFTRDQRIEHIWVQVGAVGPIDRPQFCIDAHPAKIVLRTQRRKDNR
jgi:hypothetical protein